MQTVFLLLTDRLSPTAVLKTYVQKTQGELKEWVEKNGANWNVCLSLLLYGHSTRKVTASGPSKKEALQKAARSLLENLELFKQ
jgi:dsRNA-specific ribonuclease